jgi:hypothetical protein
VVFIGELIEAGYIDGLVTRGQNGCLNSATTRGVTVGGRLLLERLENEELRASWLGRLRSAALVVLGAVGGTVLLPILADWIKKVALGLKP